MCVRRNAIVYHMAWIKKPRPFLRRRKDLRRQGVCCVDTTRS
jgi:hypothetical protein